MEGGAVDSSYTNYLLSVPPAEAERAFSVAAMLCTRIRSHLRDNALDQLCFLRSFYNHICWRIFELELD